MKKTNDTWENLLAMSGPTFAGESALPFGFMTNTMSNLRFQQVQVAEMERIGLRALLASLAALAVAAVLAVTINMHYQSGSDLDPGVRSLVQLDNISVS